LIKRKLSYLLYLIRGVEFVGSGLIRGVAFDGSGLIRGVAFDGSGWDVVSNTPGLGP
jgi:hypothetical protein